MDFSFNWIDYIILGVVLIFILYLYGTWTHDYFLKRNISFLKPVPLFGYSKKLLLRKDHQILCLNHAYNDFPGKRITGLFALRKPIFMIRDPELIRQIGVKDFDYFTNHQTVGDEHLEPIYKNGLIFLKGKKWKDMRSTLSPVFTGSKMRLMFSLISQCAQQLTDYLISEAKDEPIEKEMKDLFTKYTNDAIATAAFGIKIDSLKNPNNEFYLMGKKVMDLSGISKRLRILGYVLAPKLMRWLKISMVDGYSANFFRAMVLDTMEIREKENIFRPDMIQLLMQARKGLLKHEDQPDSTEDGFATAQEINIETETNKRVWSDDDLAAQAMLFFLAGFETTSQLLCFAAHELAINPDAQVKLIEEIDEAKQHGIPTYQSIQKLKYLDMVVSESLRKWPPAAFTERGCSKDYVIYDADGNPEVTIEKGTSILIPVMAIHTDPEYYPNPERFDPDRFSDENKNNIKPFTYLPFGVGPRNCIASRFALMQAKTVLFHILSELTFEVCSKTAVPLALSKNSILMKPDNGFWLYLKTRKKTPME